MWKYLLFLFGDKSLKNILTSQECPPGCDKAILNVNLRIMCYVPYNNLFILINFNSNCNFQSISHTLQIIFVF